MAEVLRRAKVPRGEGAALVTEAAEAAQAVSDAAHGRWVKLLNARSAAPELSSDWDSLCSPRC